MFNLKYEFRDILWYMKDNKPTQIIIDSFYVECTYKGDSIMRWGSSSYPILIYYAKGLSGTKTNWIKQSDLFKTKEELLASL